ncbi:MAG: gliding motility protein GldN [Bacteroidota bacterium]
MKYSILVLFFVLFCGAAEAQPLDDIVERKLVSQRRVLAYPPVREGDIFWEERVWRVLDVREKMNLPFAYPVQPFFGLLAEGALNGDLTLYSAEDDSFAFPLDKSDLDGILFRRDTFEVINPVTQARELRVAIDEIDYEKVRRFRIKEVWFFDEQRAALQVRIIGIAPLIEVFDDYGNFRYERPLFWVHYPSIREYLAQFKVYIPGNNSTTLSWEDWMELRFFSSTIYKTSNIYDRALREYLQGVDLLHEAEKRKQEIFNFEQDLWSR